MFGTMMAGATGLMAGTLSQGCKSRAGLGAHPTVGDPRVRGPFPILSTPFTASGAVDYDVLARQAQFVDWCGSPGMIWPQSGDSVDLLTAEEKLRGMEVLAEATRGRRSALCLGVQGKDTEEMLVFAKQAERLAHAQLLLVIGTSAVVYPAAGLAALAKRCGAVVVEINIAETGLSDGIDEFLQGPSGELLPQLIA